MTESTRDTLAGKIKAGAATGVEFGKRHGEAAADVVVQTGRAVLKTKIGKTAATGALAGGAMGAALPFVSLIAGAALGAGALVLWRGMKDKI